MILGGDIRVLTSFFFLDRDGSCAVSCENQGKSVKILEGII